MTKKTPAYLIFAVVVLGSFRLFSVQAQVDTTQSNGDDGAISIVTAITSTTVMTIGSNSDESGDSSASTTVIDATTVSTTTTVGANGAEGGSILPVTQGSNGEEGNPIIPVTNGSNGDDSGSGAIATTTATTTPTDPTVPTAPVSSGSNGGGGSSSSSGSFVGFGSFGGAAGVSSGGQTAVPITTSQIVLCPLITSYLRFGADNDGAQVALLQAFLRNNQNIDAGVTGVFDQKTDTAVRAFQTRYLSDTMGPWGANQASGYVYITTSKKINEIACNSPLTLSSADIAIIDAYKAAQNQNNQSNSTVVTPTIPVELNATTTPPVPVIGQSTPVGEANVASVANASVFTRVWDFIKGLF